ncbi:AAA family ATPase [Bariatricus sp. HCP28S3_D3]|uniref:AAA family ATPase n=1 Tax=Bariatricus sp. HCP28S3_D3 TaxID=3438901 RepID=UPI003F8BACB7
MLKISRIRICNYKGIKDSGWLEFAELNAIVGKNDAGKSAVLLAINEFFNGSCIWRVPTAGFAEQNGRNAKLNSR